MPLFTDISLGHYYSCDSFIHKLDPRTKIISILVLMIGLLFSFQPVVLIGYGLFFTFVIYLSKLPWSLVLKNLRPFIWLFILTLLIHVLWTSGDKIITIPYLNIGISHEGLLLGIVYSLRLLLLIIIAAVLTLTTSPIELTDALEKLFYPLKRFRIPTHEIVMMLTLSLRFIPTLMEEAQRIKNAQISRGVSFEGNIVNRMKNIIPLILPLFISAFKRADDLALAMDSRCYTGGNNRTCFKKLQFEKPDFISFFIIILVFCSALFFSSGA